MNHLPTPPRRPVATYSIVAHDPATGQLGAAVQSHWFCVGQLVPWARAGVGAVATQSFADPAYGPRGLALMASGMAAPDALACLVGQDRGEALRQVAFVDTPGRVGVHTGDRCIRHASHATGEGYSVQANMMHHDGVATAMAQAFEAASGPLAEQMLAALRAAQRAGGDLRGKQSAALRVVRGEASGRPWVGADDTVDLRVDDHRAPVEELQRLWTLHRAYASMALGDVALEEADTEGALAHYAAAHALVPEHIEVRYWYGLTLAQSGQWQRASPHLREVFAAEPAWVELTRRLVAPGVVEADLVERITALAPG